MTIPKPPPAPGRRRQLALFAATAVWRMLAPGRALATAQGPAGFPAYPPAPVMAVLHVVLSARDAAVLPPGRPTGAQDRMLRAERPRSRGSVRRAASVTCRTLGQVTAPAPPDAVRAVCGAWQVTLADTA